MPYKDKEKKREYERDYWKQTYIPRGHPRKMARLPMRPLIIALGWPEISLAECSRQLGIDHAFFHRMLKGGITANLADKYACQGVGQHPAVIWGRDWWRALDHDYPEWRENEPQRS